MCNNKGSKGAAALSNFERNLRKMKNLDVKQAIKASRFLQYEIAAQIGISEYTFCKWFRNELDVEKKELINSAISALKMRARNEE